MRKQHISEVIGHIDQKYVTEANTTRPRSRRNNWMKWGAAAACLALAVIAAVLLIPGRNDGPPLRWWCAGLQKPDHPGIQLS